MTFTGSVIVTASDEQVSSRVADEEVILNLKNGSYYGLNPIGAHIWELIQDPMSVDALIDQLLDEYDVTREQCTQDVEDLLQDMHKEGLLEVQSDGATSSHSM